MNKEILISVDFDQTRAVLMENDALAEIYVERPIDSRLAGNIYKGKVENVLPGMQAAFVDIGLEKNAFLYVDDAIIATKEDDDDLVEDEIGHLAINDLLRPGQEIIVQVVKEPMGSKGARITRHITLPGRYLVLMPGVDYVGVSRRIEDEGEKERLRAMAENLRPQGIGLIVRTIAEASSEPDLANDLEFLLRLWHRILTRFKSKPAPSLIHKDLGLIYRIVRDLFGKDVNRLYIDSRQEYDKIMELLDVYPSLKERVKMYTSRDKSLFELFGVEAAIEEVLKKKVWLKNGGYIVIDQTEALTAIDVNTGRYVGSSSLADTVFKTNLEAVREIARQIRLRDIGGIIVIDLIDMENPEHRQEVLNELDRCLKLDHTRSNVLGFTQLGLVEMTRKKVRQGLAATMLQSCPYCEGKGLIPSESAVASKVRREIRQMLTHSASEAILVEVHPKVASLLIGTGGSNLKELERETRKTVYIRGCQELKIDDMNIKALGMKSDVELRALPVQDGQLIEVTVEEPHATNPWDGISRLDGYVIDIEGGGKLVGEKVMVEICKVFRTYAKAKVV